jgi:plasmid maintenance system antidote protein VapI
MQTERGDTTMLSCDTCEHKDKDPRRFPPKEYSCYCNLKSMWVHMYCKNWMEYVGCASHSTVSGQPPVTGHCDHECVCRTYGSGHNEPCDTSSGVKYKCPNDTRSRPVHQQQEQAVRDQVLDECFQPSPPGDTIKDIMEEMDISRFKLGKLLGIGDEQVSKLLSGIYLIDGDMAYRLSVALGSTQDFWEERERQYRIKLREELRQSAKEP